jgi:hypothetical protein
VLLLLRGPMCFVILLEIFTSTTNVLVPSWDNKPLAAVDSLEPTIRLVLLKTFFDGSLRARSRKPSFHYPIFFIPRMYNQPLYHAVSFNESAISDQTMYYKSINIIHRLPTNSFDKCNYLPWDCNLIPPTKQSS